MSVQTFRGDHVTRRGAVPPLKFHGLAITAVFTVALAAHLWLDSAPDETTAASPGRSLKHDRDGALLLGAALLLTFGVVPGLLTDPTSISGSTMPVTMTTRLIEVVVSAIIGSVMGGFIFGRAGAIPLGIAAGVLGGLTAGIRFHDQSRGPCSATAFSWASESAWWAS